MFVDELVRNLTFYHKEDGRDYRYSDLCALTDGYCYDNTLLGIGIHMKEIENGNISLTYPIWYDIDEYTFETYTYQFPGVIGGVTLEPDGEESGIGLLYGFSAINLNYFLDSTSQEDIIK